MFIVINVHIGFARVRYAELFSSSASKSFENKDKHTTVHLPPTPFKALIDFVLKWKTAYQPKWKMTKVKDDSANNVKTRLSNIQQPKNTF